MRAVHWPRWWLLWLLGPAACAQRADVQRPFPTLEGVQSAVLVITRAEPSFGPVVWADDLDDRRLTQELLDLEADPPLALTLLLYDRPLSELFLVPGEQRVQGGGGGRRLPAGAQIFEAGTDPSQSEWRAIAGLPEGLQDLRIVDGRTPAQVCPGFAVERVTIRPRGDNTKALLFAPLDAERSVLVSLDGRIFVVRGAEATEATHSSTTTPLFATHRDGQGVRWWLGRQGTLWTGDPEVGFTAQPRAPDTSNFGWLGGSTEGTRTELYALYESQTFARFDGRDWTVLSPARANPLDDKGGVGWLGGEHVSAILDDSQSVGTYLNGQLHLVNLVSNANDELRVLTTLPGWGLMVASARGLVWRSADGLAFSALPVRVEVTPRVMLPFDDGLFFAGNDGLLQVYVPDYGLCPVESFGLGRIEWAFWRGQELLVSQNASDDDTLEEIGILRRRRPPTAP